MPKLLHSSPKYRHHKSSGQAVVAQHGHHGHTEWPRFFIEETARTIARPKRNREQVAQLVVLFVRSATDGLMVVAGESASLQSIHVESSWNCGHWILSLTDKNEDDVRELRLGSEKSAVRHLIALEEGNPAELPPLLIGDGQSVAGLASSRR